jgi:hypothetical protein
MTRCERQFLRRLERSENKDLSTWVMAREKTQTRIALRLLRRGLLCAAVSKADLFGTQPYPWKELALAVDPSKISRYPIRVPRAIRFRASR